MTKIYMSYQLELYFATIEIGPHARVIFKKKKKRLT